MSNSLDPDHFVGPDLGPKCLQKSKPLPCYIFMYYTSPQFLYNKLTRLKILVIRKCLKAERKTVPIWT